MARYRYIIFLLGVVLLSACGQVGEVTGGEEDRTAPQVKIDKVIPPMSSINIAPQKITIPFEEFIELNKPAENIRVTPADVQLNYEIKKKSLVLTVKEGEWQKNTTYTIYLNRAVKDITESNDSIMSYVFSTGSFIDSLQTVVKVVDAYTGNVVDGVTVGLYTKPLIDDTSKISPRYITSTNKDGIATFKHIKSADFYAYAFDDENRNNRLDATEKRAYLNTVVTLYDTDTVEIIGPVIRLMPPEETELKVSNNEFASAGIWGLRFSRPLNEDEDFVPLDFDEEKLKDYLVWNEDKDSVTVFYALTESSGTLSGLLKTAEKTDTINRKYFYRQKPNLAVNSNLVNRKLLYTDSLKFIVSEPIQSIDTSLIEFSAILKGDSIAIPQAFEYVPLSNREFALYFEKGKQEKLLLNIPPAAITGINLTMKDSLKYDFSLQLERETGTMIIEFDSIPPYGVLFITSKRTKEEIAVVFDGIEKLTHTLSYVQPDQYEFKFLIDEDKNGKWSTGSIFTNKEAETMIVFPDVTTIRANWSVKTTLAPIKK